MTVLIGGAVFLVAGATIALLFGWGQGDNGILLLSLGASLVAGVLLAVAYVLSKREETRGPRPKAEGAAGADAEATGEETEAEAEAEAAGPEEPEAAPDDGVVAFLARKRFHRPDCRYAERPGGQQMAKAEAVDKGLQPCGICKP